MTDHKFPVLPIKYLVNQESELTTPQNCQLAQKLHHQTHVVICLCNVRKETAHVDTKALTCVINHKGVIVAYFLESQNIKKGYLINVPC